MKANRWFVGRISILLMVLCIVGSFPVSAGEPYENYIYDNAGEKQAEPQAYYPKLQITGSSLGIGDFSSPEDCCVGPDGKIYLADSGNNRIVVLFEDFTVEKIIEGFENQGTWQTFSSPTGLFVTDKNELYIADSGSRRIIVLDNTGKMLQAIERPADRLLDTASDYIPQKVAVDKYGRIYVVAGGVNQGIVEINSDGSFFGFFGAVTVDTSFAQVLKRAFSFSGLENLLDFITTVASVPTEYSNIDIDSEGFVLGTVSIINTNETIRAEQFIHRLNPKGADVLIRSEVNPPIGDKPYYYDGKWVASQLIDIVSCDNGVYSVLDAKEGRIFTYNNQGQLMYVFGGLGTELGTFGNPTALDITVDNQYLVVDDEYGTVTIFSPTDYGAIVTSAVDAYANRKYDSARENWQKALKYTASSELVYDGVADSYFRMGDYESAMTYYRYAHNHEGYSSARKYYRNEWLNSHFGLLAGVVLTIVALWALWKIIKWQKGRKKYA